MFVTRCDGQEGEGSARRSPSNIRSLGATSRQFSRYLEDVRMQDPDDQVLESEAQREARALRVLMQKRRRVWDDWIQLRPPCAATGRRVSRPGVRLKFERDPFAFDNFPKTKLQVETVLVDFHLPRTFHTAHLAMLRICIDASARAGGPVRR